MAFSSDIAVILQRERRRMKRRSTGIRRRIRREICKSHEPSPEIPFDIVIEILTRLPAKSLMRFKSVSKLWSSLICSRNFTDRLLRVSSSSLHLYMTVSFYDNKGQLRGKLPSSTSPPGSDITTMSSFVTV
ncbi:F-box/kelch-repeat protein [Cardamine amara subsp. amara]|uniref:F-box/kelch-repeat protein n=1 Tax=Cardamine amara subsp. amara TaxID=228776 RepID=A0ABD1AEP1_CARAN